MRSAVGLAAVVGSASPLVAPPAAPGDWHQVGAAPTSRAGKAVHFFRTSDNPRALAIVVTSASSRRFRVFWWNYCEFQSDDGITEQHQATVHGVRSVTIYPPVFAGADRCYVSVNATPGGTARVTAAVFDS
jgi:hypothetical protein